MAYSTYIQFSGPGLYQLMYAPTNLPNTIDIYCFGGGAGGQCTGLGGKGGGGGGGAFLLGGPPFANTLYTINVGNGGAGGYLVYGISFGQTVIDRNQGATPGQYTMFSSPSGILCWAGGGGLASVNDAPGVGRVGTTLYSGGRGGLQGSSNRGIVGGGGGEGARYTGNGRDGSAFVGGGSDTYVGCGGNGGYDSVVNGITNATPGFAGGTVSGGNVGIGCAGGGGGGGRGDPASVTIGTVVPSGGVPGSRGAPGGAGRCTIIQYFS